MRYRLRTLLILMAIGPPILALIWFENESVEVTVCLAVLLVLVMVTARPFDLRQLRG